MNLQVPFHRIDVLEEHARARRGAVRCGIGESKTIKFDTAGLESYLFAPWRPEVFDALLLAAAVEFCDRAFQRHSFVWARRFSLSVPVHDVSRWERPEVLSALTDGLNLLTGDDWHIRFRKRVNDEPIRRQRTLPLSTGTSAVIPYSDGLDSWAAATIAERSMGPGVLRVRLGSRGGSLSKDGPKQPFSRVPFSVKSAEHPLRQSVVRSRGFKFALVSGIAAYLAEVTDVIIPESGQGSLGPVLVPVGHAHPDYRSHPLFLAHMQRFIAALLGHNIHFEFPHIWNTKGETLREALVDPPRRTSWRETRSCWWNQRWVSIDARFRQCGVCAPCMLRRLSVHSAAETEPEESYIWRNLKVSEFEAGAAPSFRRPKKAFLPYAIAGTLHMDHLANMMKSPEARDVVKRNALLLSRVLKKPLALVELRLARMLERHSEEWGRYVGSLGSQTFIRQWAQISA